jgi:hypothetical protein
VAAQTVVTDRRGTATPDPNDFKTVVDLDNAGLPTRIVAPPIAVAGAPEGWVQGVTRMVWDTNGNLVCRRSAAAEAKAANVCKANPPANDGRQTDYTYDAEAPYRRLTEKSPGPDVNNATADRQLTTYTYDEGITGLYREAFEDENMEGIPDDVRIADKPYGNWGQNPPDGLTGSDHFSVRFTGFLKPDLESGHQVYSFRIYSDDGVRLVIDKRVLVDCFNQNRDGPVGRTPPHYR